MDSTLISTLAGGGMVVVTALRHFSIAAYQNGKRDQKLASLQGELTEHKGYNPIRAHGNGAARKEA